MRTHKRDLTDRAFKKGYQAGIHGRNKEACPHEEGTIRHEWLSGWREGRTDQWDGFIGVSGIHKMEIH
jgi:ribosome modulation factor